MTNATRLRQSSTLAESTLWQALRDRRLNGWKFRRQYPIDRFIADFACLAAKLVVEVDGATHGGVEAQARDAERTRLIEAAGFHVLRVGNRDLRDNLEGVRETILAALERRDCL